MGLVTTIFTYHHAVWLGCYGIGHYHLQYHHAVWFGCYGIGHYHLHLSPCCMAWVLWDWSLPSSLITMLYGLGAMGLVTTIFTYHHAVWLGCYGIGHYHLHLSPCCMAWVLWDWSLPSSLITMLYGLGAMGLVTTILTYHHAVWLGCYGIGHYHLHLSPCCMAWVLWDWSLPSSLITMLYGLGAMGLVTTIFTYHHAVWFGCYGIGHYHLQYHHAVWFGCYGIGHYNLNLSPCCMVWVLWDWSLQSSVSPCCMVWALWDWSLPSSLITMLYGLGAMGLVTTIFTYHHAVWFGCYGIGHYHLHLSPCCMAWVLWDWSLPSSLITMLYGLGAMGLVTTIFTYHHAVWLGCYGIGHYHLHLSPCCMVWVLWDWSLPSSLITMLYGLGAMGLVTTIFTYHHAVWLGCYGIGHYHLHLSPCCMAWVLWDWSLPSSLITMLYGLGAMGLVTTIFTYHHAVWLGCYGIGHYHLHLSPCCMAWVLWDWSLPSSLITMLYGLGAMGLVTTIFTYHHAVWLGCYGIGHYHLHLSPCCMVWVLWDWSLPSSLITMLYGLGAMGLVTTIFTYHHAVWLGCYGIGHYHLHLSPCCMAWVLWDWSLPSSLITTLYGLGAMGLVTTIFTYHHAVWLGCYGIGHYHLHLSPCCMAWVLWDWSLPSSLITMLYGLGAMGLVTTMFTYHHAVWFGCYGIGHYHLHLSPCCMAWVLWDWSLPSSLITMLYGLGAMGLVTTIFTYHHAVWLGCYGIGHYHLHLSPCCMAWVLWDWSLPSSLITMLYGLGAMGLVTTIFSITMLYGLGAMGLVTTILTYHHAVWFGCYGIGHYNLNLSPCCMAWVLWDWSLPSSLITMLHGLGAMGLVTTIFTYHHAVWFGCYGIGHYHLHLSPCCMVWVLWDWSLPSSLITMLYGLGAMVLVTTIFTYHHAVWFGCYGIGHYNLQYHHAVWFGCYGIGHYNLNLSPCCMAWVLWDWSLPSSLITMLYGLDAMGLVTTIFSITMLYGLGAMGLVTTIFTYHHAVWFGCYGIGHYNLQYHHAVWFGCDGIGHYNLNL